MLKTIFIILIGFHAIIHFLGVAKAFEISPINQMTSDISKTGGLLWLGAAVLFFYAALTLGLNHDTWWVTGLAAVVLSQSLVVSTWADAKWGSIPNLLILLVALAAWSSWRFEQTYRRDAQQALGGSPHTPELLTEHDLEALPVPLQNYIRLSGAVGQPRVGHLKIKFQGEMRGKGQDWFPFTSEQFDVVDQPARLFFMKGQFFGVTVPGYHAYRHGQAKMEIRFCGLIPVARYSGAELYKTETVTLFNDLCLLAPGALTHPRFSWQAIDSLSCQGTLTADGATATALLQFNASGELINFIAPERMDVQAQKNYRWSTPLQNYRLFSGHRLTGYGDAVWHYPEGEFIYGRFYTREVIYNPDPELIQIK